MEFHDLRHYHADLRWLFRDHQRSIANRRLGEAAIRMERFHDALDRHLRDEEVNLLPAFGRVVRDGEAPGPDVFLAEHRKLRELLDAIRVELLTLASSPDPDAFIRLIEQEHRFKGLLEHHEQREENVLFRVLDERLEAEERARLIDRCSWRAETMVQPRP